MIRILALLLLTGCAGLAAADGPGRAYHLHPEGDDDAGDGSHERPWATLARLAELDLEPGDRILLAGGAEFTGQITLDASDGGSAEHPVVIGSYGEGRATIRTAAGPAIDGVDCAGITIRDLVLDGGRPDPVVPERKRQRRESDREREIREAHVGIRIEATEAARRLMPPLRIERLEIHHFSHNAIKIGSYIEANPGWNGMEFRDLDLHHNHGSGLFIYDLPTAEGYAHHDVRIIDCVARANGGGSGFTLCGIDGGLVEFCRASGNHGQGGGVGIWTYDVRGVTIRHCISDDTGSVGADGSGFDLDGGTVDSVIERCLAYDNDGIGLMHCDYPTALPTRGNVIRACIAIDNGRKGDGEAAGVGLVTWGSGLDDCHVVGNLVMLTRPHAGDPGGALHATWLHGYHHEGDEPHIRSSTMADNVVVIGAEAEGVAFVCDERPDPAPRDLRFSGNRYFAAEGLAPGVVVGAGTVDSKARKGQRYATLEAWRAATGQEPNAPVPGTPPAITADELRLTDPHALAELDLLDRLERLAER